MQKTQARGFKYRFLLFIEFRSKTRKRAFHHHEGVEATNYKAHCIYCSKEKAHTKDPYGKVVDKLFYFLLNRLINYLEQLKCIQG